MIKNRLFIILFIFSFTQTQLYALQNLSGYLSTFKRNLPSIPSAGADIGKNFGLSSIKELDHTLGKGATLRHQMKKQSRQTFIDFGDQISKLENMNVKISIEPEVHTTISALLTQCGFVFGGASLMIGSVSILKGLPHHYLTQSDASHYVGTVLGTCSIVGFLAGAALVYNSERISK